MILDAFLVGLTVLTAGVTCAWLVRLLPTLRTQLTVLVLASVCLPLALVLASRWVMFGMHADAKVFAVAIASAVSAVIAALLQARWILRPLDRLRSTSQRLARGDLGARAAETGPREVGEVAASFNEMAASIERLFDARRELVAWASHDLRTPLTSLQAMVEALEDDMAEPAAYLPAIHEQLGTLTARVADLFELAKIDAGAITLELQDAPLRDLVESCLRSLEAEARGRGITLRAHLDGDAPVRGAPDKIERILVNLLSNAIRHTPDGGVVSVTVQPDTDHVLVAVDDTGDGVTPAALPRVFERFWRDDGSRTHTTGGAGLGLAIAKGLVHAHGGRIWAENRGGGGARFAFTLPLSPVPAHRS